MINIHIQIFSKDDVVGAHMEVDAVEGKPTREVILAQQLAEGVKTVLQFRAATSQSSRTIECTGASDINKQLLKEFNLDENGKNQQG